MATKEQPLINAVSRLGALPGFLFANAFVAGVTAMAMMPVFGAIVMFFQAFGRGVVDAVELFDIVRQGAVFGAAAGALISLVALAAGVHEGEDGASKRQYGYGGLLVIIVLTVADAFAREPIRAWLDGVGPIQGPI